MILDGAAIGREGLAAPVDSLRDLLLGQYPGAAIPPMDHVVATAEPMTARVNHGRWIASCTCGARGVPTPGCVVWLGTPLGWCVRCGNRAWGGGWRPVVVPSDEERARIEAVLLCRPRVEDRNWEPGETVLDLVEQNVMHGDPVPDFAAVDIGPELGPGWRERVPSFGGRLRTEIGARWWRRLLGRR